MEAVRVLFVCLGNICRSPMAEAVMRHIVRQESLPYPIEVDSAGTGDWHLGHQPHEGTRKVLDEHGVSYEGMRARLVKPEDYGSFTYIICMDRKNLKDVRDVFRNGIDRDGKVFTFMELLPHRGVQDVPDPYYEGNFPYVYELVEEGCRALLAKIKADMVRG
ncbi:low molecular weight phosphotyrosine protein phosphatase [Paenibacillus nanensis]|uniref:protein-tyrosine-phosphatase n=1 Tax=Paenibacillus nanensis TaxID=393251 RepID=A0A3A1UYK3_9BACL|nr:low molecular weight protein-tyrosine-phosphatase [Paenibacillus nanensis]RIX53618.1 low molecular weight phosphotyrosine protein phosphatase [Paenibacillus nanensis]